MPYSQYYSDPAQYGIRQDENRQEQFRQLLNMIIASKQMKQERGEKEREWEWKERQSRQEQERWGKEFGLEERTQKETERYHTGQLAKTPEPPDAIIVNEYLVNRLGIDAREAYNLQKGIKSLSQIKEEAQARASGERAGAPPIPKEPTILDRKLTYWAAKAEKGDKEALNNMDYVMGKPYPEDYTGPKGAAARNSNSLALDKAWYRTKDGKVSETYGKKQIQDIIKQSAGNPPINGEGLRVDMPYKYNLALLNKNEKISTEEDVDTIYKYDAMFEWFMGAVQSGVEDYKGFLQWSKDKPFFKDKTFDYVQVKKWYEYYK